MRRIVLFSTILIGTLCFMFLKPVYEFYAHRGEVPMPFWNHQTIPDSAPRFNKVFSPQYQKVANKAIVELDNHRRQINSPGISAAVAINGELVWAGGSGWANLSSNQPVTAETQFRIGSTSKALTATLLARLVQDGRIGLDTPLKQLELGELNSNWSAITPRHLASHTAGLPHYGGNTEWFGLYKFMALNTHYDQVMDAVALFDETETLFAPGESFSYSSLGTVLLSAVMQEVGEKSFQVLVQNEVLIPLGMTNTLPEPTQDKTTEQMAEFYWRNDESNPIVRPWRKVDLSHRLAGGGFVSTPTDLTKLGLGFIDDGFINADIRQTFWTPQQLNNGDVNEQHYALGWRVHKLNLGDDLGELINANHGGVSRGSQSWLMVIPKHRMVVAVNINTKTEVFRDFASIAKILSKRFLSAEVNVASK